MAHSDPITESANCRQFDSTTLLKPVVEAAEAFSERYSWFH